MYLTNSKEDDQTRLGVGQLHCAMTGDGYASPGSVFTCKLYTIDLSNPSEPVMLWKGSVALGSLQHSRLLRHQDEIGSPNEASILLQESDHDREPVEQILRFKPSDRDSISMEKKLKP